MDYHLDWLACALVDVEDGVPQPPPVDGWTVGNQEDVDHIVATSAERWDTFVGAPVGAGAR